MRFAGSISQSVLLLFLISTTTTSHAFSKSVGKKPIMVDRPIIPDNSFSHQSAARDGINIMLDPLGKGMGAFASVFISKGQWMGESTGELLTRKEVEARYWDLRKENKHDRKWRNSRKRRNQGISGDYIFDMGSDVFIDGEDYDSSSWCRFSNHANPGRRCNTEARTRINEPSTTISSSSSIKTTSRCEDENYNTKAAPKLYFRGLVDIEVGQEICYDYGEEYWVNGFDQI